MTILEPFIRPVLGIPDLFASILGGGTGARTQGNGSSSTYNATTGTGGNQTTEAEVLARQQAAAASAQSRTVEQAQALNGAASGRAVSEFSPGGGRWAGGAVLPGTYRAHAPPEPVDVLPGQIDHSGAGSQTGSEGSTPPDAGAQQPVDPGGTKQKKQGRAFRI